MQSSYQIVSDQNLIRATFKGSMTFQDLVEHIERVNADPDFQKGMHTLADTTEAVLNWDFWDIDRFRTYMKKVESIRGTCKWAIVSRGGITISTVRLFMILYDAWDPLIQMKMFSNEADGLVWIESTEG